MRGLFALLSSIGLIMLPLALRAAPQSQTDEQEHGSRLTVAISDFTGDRDLTGFVAETLLTDLGHSDRLQILERTELRQAMTDLDMRDAGPLTPGQVRHLGDLLHASRFVVGSVLERDDQVVINVRMLDTDTGLNIPGSAFNVTGPRRDAIAVTHRLAHILYRKLTNENLVLDDDTPAPPPAPYVREHESAPILQEEPDVLSNGKRLGIIPSTARPNGALAAPDLAGFLGRLARRVPTESMLHLAQTTGPVSRMQALTGVVKLIVASSDMASFRTAGVRSVPDAAQIPMWGQPYLAAALDQGWWEPSAPFRPRAAATWAFIDHLLARLPLQSELPRTFAARPRIDPPIVDEVYTGLIVDARDFILKRDKSPRIVDEDGNEVYPDARHCPSPDYVEANGMAAYTTADNESRRSGRHPLVIRAIGTTGPGPFDVVVTNEDARRILDANRRSKFLWNWNVTLAILE
jgi:TolB-like protein